MAKLRAFFRREPDARICSKTGLKLRKSDANVIWRVAKTSYGPMNPPLRDDVGVRGDWGRYDVPEHRTIYGGHPIEASYAESLANQRVAMGIKSARLEDLFPGTGLTGPLVDAIDADWMDRNHMGTGKVVKGWRTERLIYPLTLPKKGWFVEIEAPESLAVLTDALGSELTGLGVGPHLTLSHLKGEDRFVTTTIAAWLWQQILDDGSLPHGVIYESKHGTGWTCWAVWLRAVDDGRPLTSEPTVPGVGHEIGDPLGANGELERVAQLFDLKIF